MTNDRFSAQLRQHLLDTANERVAEGQFASVVDRVAVTSQRPTLVARLPWFQGLGRSSRTSKLGWGLVVLALIGATIAGALIVGGPSPRGSVFEGTWTAIDESDGSTQFLVVAASDTPAVRYVDDFASGAVCRDDPVRVFTVDGSGAVTGDRLHVTWTGPGGCGLQAIPMGEGVYTYDETTDTLVDDFPNTWTRADAAIVAPTRAPAPERTLAPSATANPDCIQFDASGTYTAPAGSMSLTVVVSGTPTEPWIGERDQFDLLRASCTDWSGPGKVHAAEISQVYTDACSLTGVAVNSAADAAAAVSVAKGLEVVGQTDVTIGGHTGSMLDIRVPNVPNTCPDFQITVSDGLDPFDLEVTYRLYLIDVDGMTLALALYGVLDWSPAVSEQVDAILASLQIDTSAPAESSAPVESTAPIEELEGDCVVFRGPGEYTANAGPLSLTVDVPASSEETWHGSRDEFSLLKAPCIFGGPWLEGSIVNEVYPDACYRLGTGVSVATPAEAIAALTAITGVDVGDPTDVTIGGYAGSRFEIRVSPEYVATACGDGSVMVTDGLNNLDPGVTTVYVLDVDGTPLALGIFGIEDGDAALTALFDQVVASMQIER